VQKIVQQPELKLEKSCLVRSCETKITHCKFHNKVFDSCGTAYHSMCSKCFPLALTHAQQGKLAIGQSPDQRHFAGCQATLQSEAASVHRRSVFNRFWINTFHLQYSTYPAIHSVKVRTVRRPYVCSDEVCGLALQQLFYILRCCLLLSKQ